MERDDGGRIILSVAGEIDVSNADDLRTRVDQAFLSGSEVVVDAADVEFIDSSGLNALIAARNRAGRLGVEFHLENVPAPVRRTIESAGLEEYFALR